jgi:hypothetical protein
MTTGTWKPIHTTAAGKKQLMVSILFLIPVHRLSSEIQSHITERNFPIFNFIFPKTVAAEDKYKNMLRNSIALLGKA